MLRRTLTIGLVALLMTVGLALAADDPSIPRDVGKQVRLSVETFINLNTMDSLFPLFDPVEGRLLELKMVKIHDGIAMKGDFYVKCVDFTDQYGRTVDVDFLTWPRRPRPGYRTTQALVHKVDGAERSYRLDPRRWLPLMKKP